MVIAMDDKKGPCHRCLQQGPHFIFLLDGVKLYQIEQNSPATSTFPIQR